MAKTKHFICVLCHQLKEGYGNNALPVREGLCCDSCNEEVIMERIRLMEARENE
jgi:hypothetical protein